MTKAANEKGPSNTPYPKLLQISVHCSLAQSPDSDTQVLVLRLWILPACHRNISSSSIILVQAHGSRPRSTPDGRCGFECRGTTTWSSNIIVEIPYTQNNVKHLQVLWSQCYQTNHSGKEYVFWMLTDTKPKSFAPGNHLWMHPWSKNMQHKLNIVIRP